MLICEMTLYYKNKGMSLYDALMDLYMNFGFYKEELISIELQGKEGAEKIAKALEYLRSSMNSSIDGVSISKIMDYKVSVEKDKMNSKEISINLPKSNVLKFILEDGSWFVVRPSGTEPKMKVYLSVVGKSVEDTDERMSKFKLNIMKLIEEACNC
jgi:phosphoglucomutase